MDLFVLKRFKRIYFTTTTYLRRDTSVGDYSCLHYRTIGDFDGNS